MNLERKGTIKLHPLPFITMQALLAKKLGNKNELYKKQAGKSSQCDEIVA